MHFLRGESLDLSLTYNFSMAKDYLALYTEVRCKSLC